MYLIIIHSCKVLLFMVMVALASYVVVAFLVSTLGMLSSAATLARNTATGISCLGIGAMIEQTAPTVSSAAQVAFPVANMVRLSLFPETPAIIALAPTGPDLHGKCIACDFAAASSIFSCWKAM